MVFYFDEIFDICRINFITGKTCFDFLNKEFERNYGRVKYSSYESYKVIRNRKLKTMLTCNKEN